MSQARRNHYVPKFLSRQFADKSGLLYFARKGVSIIEPIRPRSLFVELDLYSLEGDYINVTTNIEGEFSKLESMFAPIHRNIIKSIRNQETPYLSTNDRNTIEDFIIIQSKRTPALPSYHDDTAEKIVRKNLEALRNQIHKEHGSLGSTQLSELIDSPEFQEESVKLLKLNSMAPLVGKNIKDSLMGASIRFISISQSNSCFIIGDNPVLWNSGNYQLDSTGSDRNELIFFTISRDIAIVFETDYKKSNPIRGFIDTGVIRQINERIRDQSTIIAGPVRGVISSLSNAWHH